jgi:hypothetical protein
MVVLTCIFSGGQTGVDRAAGDAVQALSRPYRGWCPRGRRAEDGPLDVQRYPTLQETPSDEYSERTRWNVRDSNATLILVLTSSSISDPVDLPSVDGTAWTMQCALELGKPHLVVVLADSRHDTIARVCEWLRTHSIQVLNVAGPRESTSPGLSDCI